MQSLNLLIKTIRTLEKEISPDVAVALAKASGGYPFALQTLGFEAWEIAGKTQEITINHALIAIEHMEDLFSSGLFQQRWIDVTPEQREYLRIMATLLSGDKISEPVVK